VNGVDTVHYGHLNIEKGHIGSLCSELLHSFQAIRRLRDQMHVILVRQHGCQALTKYRMIIRYQNRNAPTN
jgi:hypothetical protein